MARVVILYSSLKGHTRTAAEHVAAGARLVPQAEAILMDAAALDMDALESADGLAIGSPNYFTYCSGLIKHFFDLAYGRSGFKGKPYVSFSTHGGGGGISGTIDTLAQAVGMKQVHAGLDFLESPQGDQPKDLRKLGQTLAAKAAAK
jgi:multimeric flavodoxin WrbA